jgi:hypothetical protein
MENAQFCNIKITIFTLSTQSFLQTKHKMKQDRLRSVSRLLYADNETCLILLKFLEIVLKDKIAQEMLIVKT